MPSELPDDHANPEPAEPTPPTGLCPECGGYIYDGAYLHPECADRYVAYCNGEGSLFR